MLETCSGGKTYPRSNRVHHETVSFRSNRILRFRGQLSGWFQGGVTKSPRRRHYNCFVVFEMDSESFCYGIKTFEKLFYHPKIILHRYDGSYIAKNNPQMAKYEEMSCFAKFITLLPVCWRTYCTWDYKKMWSSYIVRYGWFEVGNELGYAFRFVKK